MARRLTFVIAISIALSCLFAPVANGQQAGGTISGTVLDSSAAAYPNAEVTIANLATGISRVTKTNDAGLFTAPNLTPGTYQVSISAPGFTTYVQTVDLNVGSTEQINAKLAVGSTSEKVVVEGAPPDVDLSSSTVKATVEARTIRELPLNGRDWTMLAALEPGVHTIDSQTVNAVGNTGRINRGWGTQLTVGGARPQQNNYRLDGISINDYSGGGPGNTIGGNLGVEAIQEYSVVNADPSGEYGKTSGGVFNAITRAGTNSFHGSVYEFLRNSAFDARSYFDGPSVPPFKRNQFGGAIGGPVYFPGYNGKNKTFFFFNYEGLRQGLSSTLLNPVPSSNARLGHLTTGNVTVSPAIKPFLALYPGPNYSDTGDVGYASTVQKLITNENFYTFRIDHTISGADNIHGTFMNDHSESSSPDPLLLFEQANVSGRKMISIEETHTFSSNFLNTARIGFSRVVALGPIVTDVLNPLLNDPTLGFLPGHPFGNLQVQPLTRISGKDPNTATFYYNSYQGYDDVYYTVGRHFLKAGFSVEHNQLNQFTASAQDGAWTFGSLKNFLTNASATSFVTQLPGTTNITTYLRQSIFGGYVQDDFKFRPNLTINLGLRYEPVTVPTEINNHLATLDTLTSPTPRLGSPYFQNPTLRNFSPRIGFSWDPFRNGKTSVRGGFGVYDVLPLLYEFELSTLLTSPFYQGATLNKTPAGVFPAGAVSLVTPDAARVSYVQQNPSASYVEQWNFNIQREVVRNFTLQLGYVGSHGVHLPYKTQDADWVMPTQVGGALYWPTPVGSGTEINTRVGQINGTAFIGSSSYNAANVRATWEFKQSRLGLSYTWAKSIDNNTASVAG
ncbi:MAG: TonB-dependent receptor domain-containing protein, partial [Terriglobales bacterium]